MARRLIILLTLLVTSFAPAAGAQTAATVSGTVHDASEAVLPGVTVTAKSGETGLTRTAVTGAEGRFVIAQLPPGVYEIRAELAGFKPHVRPEVALAVAQSLVLNITLQVGELTIVDVVTAEIPIVNTSTSELSYLVTAEQIDQIPLNGRNYTDLALLQPGVNAFPHRDGGSVVAHGLGMSINGQDPRSNVYLLDGTLTNDFTNGPAGSAAGTALGLETIREFRVQSNAYSAEFGRNSGGQINVLTKSGTNRLAGSAFEFHRNDAMDAKNFFDTRDKPDFHRNQFGGTIGGPITVDRAFFFLGYEALIEQLGRTVSTVVPDDNARLGILPAGTVPVNPAVQPYLQEFPRANGAPLGQGLAEYNFPFEQTLDQHFVQGRIDYNATASRQFFGRYTLDDTNQFLPTDYPQFPREFFSRNQFFTGRVPAGALQRARSTRCELGFSRTRIGQNVESNTHRAAAVRARARLHGGDRHRRDEAVRPAEFGEPAPRAERIQPVERPDAHAGTAHAVQGGRLAERYQDNMVNPTFSLGIYAVRQPHHVPARGAGDLHRAHAGGAVRPLLALHAVRLLPAGRFQVTPRLTLNGGLRYEFHTMPKDIYGRDSALPDLTASAPTTGQLYDNSSYTNVSPRTGFAWDVFGDGRTSVRGGYGLYFNTNSHQNLIVTVTNPPATPRPVIIGPTFPSPPFDRAAAISIRPVQWDLEVPRVHVFNVNVQREIWARTSVTLGYAGSRGRHLLRSNDVNTARPTTLPDGSVFIPAGTPRPNPAFSTIELKSSDGESWYNAFIFDVRKRFDLGFSVQSSYTLSKSEDTTQASTFFSDATNGTTSAFPEYIPGYNKGPSDFDTRHAWVVNFTVDLPGTDALGGLFRGWQASGIWNMRSGQPLTVFVQANRSRSLWTPSLGPGIGADRPSYAPGYGPDNAVLGRVDQWFDPNAFVLQPAGTFGNTGRGDFIGPNLRTLDVALSRRAAFTPLGANSRIEFRLEAFNLLNRANFGPPALLAFAGTADNQAPFSTFGRITTTVTSARQVQLGVKVLF
jgi:hypothetical protein